MKINVQLYGGKSIFKGVKETPLEAEITYCDRCEQCSFYKNNTCYGMRSFLNSKCKYAKSQTIKGYTSKAKKYYDFRNMYKNDEMYNKLTYPKLMIGKIDDEWVIKISFISLNKDGYFETPFGDDSMFYVEDKEFTNGFIKRILDFKPRNWFGEIISSYQEEKIPKFLDHFKRNFNNRYNEFIKEYPEYDKEINYIGRKAYIYSLKDNIKIGDRKGEFIKQDGYLIGNYKSVFLPFGVNEAEVKLKITDKMVWEITDNSQVDENTKFAD